jgi:hypothetical protein
MAHREDSDGPDWKVAWRGWVSELCKTYIFGKWFGMKGMGMKNKFLDL